MAATQRAGLSGDSPQRLTLPAHTLHLWWAPARAPDDQALAALSAAEHAQARRFAFDRDRQRHLATRWLLRRTLSRYAPLAPADWRFALNPWGRPHIDPACLPAGHPAGAVGAAAPLHFNLSHSADVVLLAVGTTPLLGLDVEAQAPEDLEAVAAQVFSPPELAWLRHGPQATLPQRFLRLWTLKEALVKALGQGFSAPLERLAVLPHADGDCAPEAAGDPHTASVAQLLQAPLALEPEPAAWRFFSGRVGPSALPWALAVRDPLARLRWMA